MLVYGSFQTISMLSLWISWTDPALETSESKAFPGYHLQIIVSLDLFLPDHEIIDRPVSVDEATVQEPCCFSRQPETPPPAGE